MGEPGAVFTDLVFLLQQLKLQQINLLPVEAFGPGHMRSVLYTKLLGLTCH